MSAFRRVVLATRNPGKVAEFEHAFPGIELVSLDTFPDVVMPEETGSTFEENARIKAVAIANATGLPAIADDSGLAVDALNGAPGIYSARFAGTPSNDAANRALLKAKLAGVAAARRTARFVCALALAFPQGTVYAVRGECRGRIGEAERGTGGFGYDALFVPDGEMRTFAEIEPREKERMSHRGEAIRAARASFLRALS